MDRVLSLGGCVAFELAAGMMNNSSSSNRIMAWQSFTSMVARSICMVVRCCKGRLTKKPWAVSTADLRLIQYLDQRKCDAQHEDEHAMGGNASKTAFYTRGKIHTQLQQDRRGRRGRGGEEKGRERKRERSGGTCKQETRRSSKARNERQYPKEHNKSSVAHM